MIDWVLAPPDLGLVLALLALGAAVHGLALLATGRGQRQPAGERGEPASTTPVSTSLSALGQTALLAALVGTTLRLLEVADPATWLPARAAGAVEAAGWLALVLYLVAGFWWRSPGLGLALPLLVAGLLVAAEATAGAASVTRGLFVTAAWRPAVAIGTAVVLALATLALAGLLARAIEARRFGAPRLGRRLGAVLLTAAVTGQTAILTVTAWSWLGGGRETATWTPQQTWLAASWLVLLLAAEASWRRRPVLPALTVLGTGLLLIGLVVVSGVGSRS